MKVSSFLKRLIEDWPVKILCFVIALFLYLFYEISLVETQTLVVPITVKQNGGVELVSNIQRSVKVTVRTKNTTTIHEDDFHAVLDLGYLTESGTYDVPVTFTVSDDLMEMDPLEIKIKPESLSAHVEKKVTSGATISVPYVGAPDYGYKLTSVSVSPDMVSFYGPESIVKGTKDISTDPVSLNGLSSDKEFSVHLQKSNRLITLNEEPVYKVNVTIEPVIAERKIDGITPLYLNIPENMQLESKVHDISVKVSGPLLNVEKLTPSSFSCVVNLSDITEVSEYDFPVVIEAPSGIQILEKSEENWKLIISEKISEEVPETEEQITE